MKPQAAFHFGKQFFFVFTTRGIIHKYIEEDLTEWNTENGEYFFMENHCPIGAAAAECLGFCDAELSNFKKLIGNGFQIERIQHIRSGEHRCIYKIS